MIKSCMYCWKELTVTEIESAIHDILPTGVCFDCYAELHEAELRGDDVSLVKSRLESKRDGRTF